MFIVPLIDTITVTIRRLMRKQSPFVGGKDHITHHLVISD
jgi:UDP-GlcNAc:undecaprenyl-phosphate GlcNAc-1-phosphate transferase